MAENANENPLSEPQSPGVTDLLPTGLVKYLSIGGALYLVWSLINSEQIISAIKSSPNMAAVVISFIAFAAAYTLAKYVAQVLENKDAARHRQIESWFAMVLDRIEKLQTDMDSTYDVLYQDIRNELESRIGNLQNDLEKNLKEALEDQLDAIDVILRDNLQEELGKGAN